MIEIKLSGINLESFKSFQEQGFSSENLMKINMIPRHNPVKDPNSPNRITFNDSAHYDALLYITTIAKDVCYDLFIAWLLSKIQDGEVTRSFKIGDSPVLEELSKLSLETLAEEEQLKKAEIKLKRLLIEAEINKLEKLKE